MLGKDITYYGEGIVNDCNLDGVVRLEVVKDCSLPVHVAMDSEKIRVAGDLVVDQPHVRHRNDGVTGLGYRQCGGTTAGDTLVEHTVDRDLRHSFGDVDGSRWSS